MRTALIVFLAAAGLALVWPAASAQQEVFRTPGPGTGMVTVQGSVDIGNVPDVNAAQRGEWQVAVSNVPTVVTAAPDFVARGGRFTVEWSGGERETVTIVAPGQAGWVQVEHPSGKGRRRWVNLAAALAVEEVR